MDETKKEVAVKKQTFEKEQILQSEKFKEKRDLLDAVLEDEKLFTIEEVNKIIEKFMKGKVK